MTLGTLAWARATGGRLRPRDRVAYLTAAVARQLRVLPAELWWRVGLPRHPARVDIEAIRPPDTVVATAAERHLETIAEPYMVNHSIRTWAWGRVVAALDGVRFDDELLWVASLMHDAGVLEPHRRSAGECFSLRSADAARQVVSPFAWDAARGDRLAETITLHLNPYVPPARGAEAHLMSAGVLLDVIGVRFWDLHPEVVQAVLARWPRHDMKRRLWADFAGEALAHPACRGHFAKRWLQFGWRVRSAPFAE